MGRNSWSGGLSRCLAGFAMVFALLVQADLASAESSDPIQADPPQVAPTGAARAGRAQPAVPTALDLQHAVILSGDVPLDDFPTLQQTADAIWAHLTHRVGIASHHPPPVIHFRPFDKAMQSDDWTTWQMDWTRTHPVIWRDWTALKAKGTSKDIPLDGEVSQGWIDDHIAEIFPFPKTFLAFHYDGTNRIQINPERTFLASVQLDPYGIRRDFDGRGYYSLAHEMLHYALELRGVVPTKLHHCLMVFQPADDDGVAMMEEVADYLVDSGTMASIARHRGLQSERAFSPCAALTDAERGAVDGFYAQLQAATPNDFA
ncbi:MAG: hypothetical protein WBM40_20655, partial [Thiohalocapsa sp.]